MHSQRRCVGEEGEVSGSVRYKVCNVKAVVFGSPTTEVTKHRCVCVDLNVIVIVRMVRLKQILPT